MLGTALDDAFEEVNSPLTPGGKVGGGEQAHATQHIDGAHLALAGERCLGCTLNARF